MRSPDATDTAEAVTVDRDQYERFVELIRADGEPILLAVYGKPTIHIPCRFGDEPWELIEQLLTRYPGASFGAVINPPRPYDPAYGTSPDDWSTSLDPAVRQRLAAQWAELWESLPADVRELFPWDWHSAGNDLQQLIPADMFRYMRKWGAQDNHILHGLGVWLDFDRGDRHQQEAAIAEMGDWSAVIQTGGKSLHSYRLVAPGHELTLPQFRGVADGLFRHVDAAYPDLGVDTSVGSPCHVMRLPGARHPKTGQVARVLETGTFFPRADLLRNVSTADIDTLTAKIERADAAPQRLDELWLARQSPARRIELLAAMLRFIPPRDAEGTGTFRDAWNTVAALVHFGGQDIARAAILAATWQGSGPGSWSPADAIREAAKVTPTDRPARIGKWVIDRAAARGWVKPPDMPDAIPMRPGPTYDHQSNAELLDGADVPLSVQAAVRRARQDGGFPFVVVSNPCGSRKTLGAHAMHRALLALDGIERVIFVSSSYRLLPAPELNKYVKPPARHCDVIREELQEGEKLRTRRRDEARDRSLAVVETATCTYQWALGDATQQGASHEHISSFCRVCPFAVKGCRFIDERTRFLMDWQRGGIQCVRTNIELLPFLLTTLSEEQRSKVFVVFDEGDQADKAINTRYEIPYERMDLWLQHIRLDGRYRSDDLLRELIELLRDLPVRIPEKERHGWDLDALKKHMRDWLAKFNEQHPDGMPESWANLAEEGIFGPLDVTDIEQPMVCNAPLLLPAIVEALTGVAGSVFATRHPKGTTSPGLRLTVPTGSLQGQLRTTAGIVLLDATSEAATMQRKLCGVDGDRPVIAANIRTRLDTGLERVRFIQVADIGALVAGHERPSLQTARARAFIAAVQRQVGWQEAWGELPAGRTGTVAVLEQPNHARKGNMRWCVDHRGSNAARSCAAMVCVGLPWLNIGGVKSDLQAQRPDVTPAEIEIAYRQRVGEELIQGLHRMRFIDLQDGETVTVYLLTSADLSGMGLEIEQMAAADFCWQAGSEHHRTVVAASAAIDELFGGSITVKLAQVCAAAGIVERTLRRAMQTLGMSWLDVIRLPPWRAASFDMQPVAPPRRRGRPKQTSADPIRWLASLPPLDPRQFPPVA